MYEPAPSSRILWCFLPFIKAVLDRIDEQFEFPLPGFEERRRMIMMFFDEYIHQLTRKGKKIKVDTDIDDAFLELIAKKTEAFSGRQLAKVNGIMATVSNQKATSCSISC